MSEEKERRKRYDKIVDEPVKKKNRTLGQAMIDIFFPGSVDDIAKYMIYDLAIPKIKKAIPVIGRDILEMLVSPDGSNRSRSYRDRERTRVSYNRVRDDDRYRTREVRSKHSAIFENPLFDSRREAEKILEALLDSIEEFGMVSVMDLYDMLGEDTNFADDRYGWTDLRRAEIRPYRGDFLLDLPRPKFIN